MAATRPEFRAVYLLETPLAVERATEVLAGEQSRGKVPDSMP